MFDRPMTPLRTALVCWFVSSAIVVVCAVAACPAGKRPIDNVVVQADGAWYRKIAEGGYEYGPNGRSNTAFFPAYPVTARLLARATGLSVDAALLVTANAFVLAALVAFAAYLYCRGACNANAQRCAIASLALFPTTFFFRMAYAESLLLTATVLAFLGMTRNWPLWTVALLAGLATAARPVGAAVMLPFAAYLWQGAGSCAQRMARFAWLPLACWGLLAWIGFQWVQFGEPLAFARTQAFWGYRPPVSTTDKLVDLALLEPIWSVYAPASSGYWRAQDEQTNVLLSLPFANPIYFVGAILLVASGTWKRWLTGKEALLSVGLLAIPYLTRAHEMCMASHGRFAAVAFPAFIVVGQLLSCLPVAVAAALLALSAILMGAYTAQFAAGYNLI